MMLRFYPLASLALLLGFSTVSPAQESLPIILPITQPITPAISAPENLAFQEIWAYVMAEDQSILNESLPITDLAYFSAGINNRGELIGGGPAPKRAVNSKIRRHLVLAVLDNAGLLHFALAPEYPIRDKLVRDLVEKARDYDGVQIDFETIAAYDKNNFRQFLVLLKSQLNGKIVSVALPARTKAIDDAFAYAEIAAIVDKILIMAYDEHWSSSKPGSIASIAWCRTVADYAITTIGLEKVIMGLPFYGRVWGEKNPAGAYKFATMERLQKENSTAIQRDAEGIPYFNFSTTINYTAYYEDLASISLRASLYQKAGIGKIGFWRLGLEDPAIWGLLKVTNQN